MNGGGAKASPCLFRAERLITQNPLPGAPPQAKIILGDARRMIEVADEAVHLVVTSPPYWQIKDYGTPGQIGYGQSLHEYLFDLSRVWRECWRVLPPGRRLCINIGDQFARATVYGRYKVIPLHSEVIAQCEAIGFDYMGAIIWQKKSTMQTSGGAVVMGSFPYPPNGIVELDYEFILLFKKPGEGERVPVEIKASSRLTKAEWKEYFRGHWTFGGTRQHKEMDGHEAMFPDELPRRLIKMFSFAGETVLDPFLGSGTTAKVAQELGRQAAGYETQRAFLPLIEGKLGPHRSANIVERVVAATPVASPDAYMPQVQDAAPLREPVQAKVKTTSYKVVEIIDGKTLRLDNQAVITLLGVDVPPDWTDNAWHYLDCCVRGRRVLVKPEAAAQPAGQATAAYLYLTNKLFVNRKMIEMGLAVADRSRPHLHLQKFMQAEAKAPATTSRLHP